MCGFDPWVGKIPWRRERLSTPVFWPGEFHGLYNPWGRKESDMTNTFTLILSCSCPLPFTFNYSSFLSHVCCASFCTPPTPPSSPQQKKTNLTLTSWFLSLALSINPYHVGTPLKSFCVLIKICNTVYSYLLAACQSNSD